MKEKLPIINFPPPTHSQLLAWQKQINNCLGIETSLDLILFAYYFEQSFRAGLSWHDKKGIFLFTPTEILPTTAREGMIDAISILVTGKRYPHFNDTKTYKTEIQEKFKKLDKLNCVDIIGNFNRVQ